MISSLLTYKSISRSTLFSAQPSVWAISPTAYYLRDDTAPETKEAFEEIPHFFDKHLGK
jgi:hypothetical protein